MRRSASAQPAHGDIFGPRVALRPWKGEDERACRMWATYPDPFSKLWNLPRSRSLYEEFFTFFSGSSGTRRSWAIENQAGQLIGRLSLREIDPWKQRARLGISLGADYVGQGLGTEALALFLDHFFGVLEFTTMALDVAACNGRAVRCYERLGFRHIRQEWRKAGHAPCLQLLQEPAYHHLLPFFRNQAGTIWVQFLEMELQKSWWVRLMPGREGRTVECHAIQARI
ncbi:MAG: GNAT family N-acetyltransferase [Chloroflexaceae bacterium]|nr:GNAT family N-acetyltransferase [Chloroflexaceae bacterium]